MHASPAPEQPQVITHNAKRARPEADHTHYVALPEDDASPWQLEGWQWDGLADTIMTLDADDASHTRLSLNESSDDVSSDKAVDDDAATGSGGSPTRRRPPARRAKHNELVCRAPPALLAHARVVASCFGARKAHVESEHSVPTIG